MCVSLYTCCMWLDGSIVSLRYKKFLYCGYVNNSREYFRIFHLGFMCFEIVVCNYTTYRVREKDWRGKQLSISSFFWGDDCFYDDIFPHTIFFNDELFPNPIFTGFSTRTDCMTIIFTSFFSKIGLVTIIFTDEYFYVPLFSPPIFFPNTVCRYLTLPWI